jgi:hypothetical protein
MYVDSSPVFTRRFAGTPRLRSARRETIPHTANATLSAAARRARLADAIISQWLLEQVPSDHRHALRRA